MCIVCLLIFHSSHALHFQQTMNINMMREYYHNSQIRVIQEATARCISTIEAVQTEFEYDCEEGQDYVLLNEINRLSQNITDQLHGYAAEIGHMTRAYNEYCRPIINGSLDLPAPIIDKSEEMVELARTKAAYPGEGGIHAHPNDYRLIDTVHGLGVYDYKHRIELCCWWIVNGEEESSVGMRNLNSDHDSGQQFENMMRMRPILLLNCDTILKCSKLRLITFLPQVFQLRTEIWDGLNIADGRVRMAGLITRSYDIDDGLCPLQRLVMAHNGGRGLSTQHDDRCLGDLIRLYLMGFFRREFVSTFGLLQVLICSSEHYFLRNTFLYLSELKPDALVVTDGEYCSPLFCSSIHSTLDEFQFVFQTGLFLQLTQGTTGLLELFKIDHECTAFDVACAKHGATAVLQMIGRSMVRYRAYQDRIAETLIVMASDGNYDLEGVFYLLRNEPDVLSRLLSTALSPD